jgi:hypothetical protein
MRAAIELAVDLAVKRHARAQRSAVGDQKSEIREHKE